MSTLFFSIDQSSRILSEKHTWLLKEWMNCLLLFVYPHHSFANKDCHARSSTVPSDSSSARASRVRFLRHRPSIVIKKYPEALYMEIQIFPRSLHPLMSIDEQIDEREAFKVNFRSCTWCSEIASTLDRDN